MIIYVEIVSLIRISEYPDSQLGNGGVRISEAPLYVFSIVHQIGLKGSYNLKLLYEVDESPTFG